MFGGWIPLFDAKNRINSLNQIKGVPVRTLFWMRSLVALLCPFICGQCPEKHHSRGLPKNNPVLLCCYPPPHLLKLKMIAVVLFRHSSSYHNTTDIRPRRALEKSFPFYFSGHHDEALQNYSCCFSWMIRTCKDSGNCLRTTRWGQNTVWVGNNMSGE